MGILKTIPLEHAAIVEAMTEELDSKAMRFNRVMLEQYVDMQLLAVKPSIADKKEQKTSVDNLTLKKWVYAFLTKHN